jgi:hypothetical protein
VAAGRMRRLAGFLGFVVGRLMMSGGVRATLLPGKRATCPEQRVGANAHHQTQRSDMPSHD